MEAPLSVLHSSVSRLGLALSAEAIQVLASNTIAMESKSGTQTLSAYVMILSS